MTAFVRCATRRAPRRLGARESSAGNRLTQPGQRRFASRDGIVPAHGFPDPASGAAQGTPSNQSKDSSITLDASVRTGSPPSTTSRTSVWLAAAGAFTAALFTSSSAAADLVDLDESNLVGWGIGSGTSNCPDHLRRGSESPGGPFDGPEYRRANSGDSASDAPGARDSDGHSSHGKTAQNPPSFGHGRTSGRGGE